MNPPSINVAPSLSAELAHRVEAFELVLEVTPDADLAAYIPAPNHPLYLAILSELIRVDIEHAWNRGKRKRVSDYTTRFPVVLTNPMLLAGIAFEEYRQRVRIGDSVKLEEYERTYGVDTSGWADFGPESAGSVILSEEYARTQAILPPRKDADPGTAAMTPPPPTQERLAAFKQRRARAQELSEAEELACWQEATASLPDVGTEFAGFHLVAELGRGAFGRVYLARQGDLAGRLVALKVASGLGAESNTLAQLQHPNIVPIYSYHSAGPFQAVCMPYLGGTTLAQVVQHIITRPGVPSSGKELRSTLSRARAETSIGNSSRESVPASSVGQPASSVAKPSASEASQTPAGDQTHDGWARLEGLPFVDAVLALGGQLADGLAHAHRRGILHRDLKPANVLLTDEGRPLLLDFNLAEDTKRRGAERAAIGGTLPYMAPEHMAAFRSSFGSVDARCDLYGLGVILFEMLTGRHPFPIRKGPPRETVPLMIADRATPPAMRNINPAIPPSVEAVIHKCLASDPTKRYQHAEDLREDIDRHLANRPLMFAPEPSRLERLRKWMRRHPRLTSSFTVAAIAAMFLCAIGGTAVYARERSRDLEARGYYAQHQTAFRDAQTFLDDRTRSSSRLDEGLEKLRGVLDRSGVQEDEANDRWQSQPTVRHLPAAEQERVKGDIGEIFFLMAQTALLKATGTSDPNERTAQLERAVKWNALAEHYSSDRLPRAIREQRATLAEFRNDRAEAARLRAEAEATPLQSARDYYLAGSQLTRNGKHRDAIKYLRHATQLDPENFSAWFLRGTAHLAVEQDEFAAMCFTACVSLRPDFAPAWTSRGLALAHLRFYPDARSDCDQAIKLDPKLTEAYIQRGAMREVLKDYDGAIEDYTLALATGTAPARVYFRRATAKFYKKDFEGAAADRNEGFKVTPTDELSWIARAENRLPNDPKTALAEVEEALKINPWSVFGLQLKAAILSEFLKKPDEAIKVLDTAVKLHPDFVQARAGRGVLLARSGKRDDALRDAQDSLRRDTHPSNLYQVGCIYALTAKSHPDDSREAIKLLWGALKTGAKLDIVDTDPDLNAIRASQDFQALVKDAKALYAQRQEK